MTAEIDIDSIGGVGADLWFPEATIKAIFEAHKKGVDLAEKLPTRDHGKTVFDGYVPQN